jgi:leucyl-tRNA synthetase
VTVAPDATDEQIQAAALADPGVQAHIAGKTVKKVIVAGGRLVSVVVG